jgi:hypothetical protein
MAVTRREWNDLAATLAKMHARLVARRRIERAVGVELAARALCMFLRARSGRFDSRKFMRAFTAAK